MPPTPQSIIDERRSRQRQAALACTDDDIWNAAQTQGETSYGKAKVFTYPLGSEDPEFFVKFIRISGKWLLEPERRNHEFIFNALRTQKQPASEEEKRIVCVPEIFRAFEHRECYFLVMEYVSGQTLEQILIKDNTSGAGEVDRSELYKHIAEGIRLLSVKAPPGSKPGPVGGGIIRHPFFNDDESATPYRDVEMLEKHMNKASVSAHRSRRAPGPPPTVHLERELEFYYADLWGGNFIFTTVADYDVLYILDFDEAGFLPHSFTAWVLDRISRPASIHVADNIVNLLNPNKDNVQAMGSIHYFLQTSSYRFGLPLEGYPETDLETIRNLKNDR